MRSKVAYFGVFTALAIMISYVEMLIPFNFGIPGVKLGLTNVVILMILYSMGEKEAFLLSIVRIILAGFLFGNMSAMIYSMAGGILSFLAMAALKRIKSFSILGVSVAGGVFHNTGQILVAAAVVDNLRIFYYLPILLISGILTGILIGALVSEIRKRVPNIRDFDN